MRVELPVPVGTLRLPMGRRVIVNAAVLVAAALLSVGCSTVGRGVPPQNQQGAADAKAASIDRRPQVLLQGAGDDGEDLSIGLPAWPAEQELIPLRQGLRPDLRFWVDPRSLELLPGGEVRYTFVARSASGARAVTFEGMRCASRERIILATGSLDGKWVPARSPRWDRVDFRDPTGMREVLHKDIFCPARVAAASVAELRSALKAGIHPRAVLD